MGTSQVSVKAIRFAAGRRGMERVIFRNGFKVERVLDLIMTTDADTGLIQWTLEFAELTDDRPCEATYVNHYQDLEIEQAVTDLHYLAHVLNLRCRRASYNGWVCDDDEDD